MAALMIITGIRGVAGINLMLVAGALANQVSLSSYGDGSAAQTAWVRNSSDSPLP